MSEQDRNLFKFNLEENFYFTRSLFFITSLIIQVFIIKININEFTDVENHLLRYSISILANATICCFWINSQVYRLINIEDRVMRNIILNLGYFLFLSIDYFIAFKVYQFGYFYVLERGNFKGVFGILLLLFGIFAINLKYGLSLQFLNNNYRATVRDGLINIVSLMMISILMYCSIYTANNNTIALINSLNN